MRPAAGYLYDNRSIGNTVLPASRAAAGTINRIKARQLLPPSLQHHPAV